MTIRIRNEKVHGIVCRVIDSESTRLTVEASLNAIRDFRVPQAIIDSINNASTAEAQSKLMVHLDEFVHQQTLEDQAYGTDSSNWVIYASQKELQDIKSQVALKLDSLNKALVKAKQQFQAPNSSASYHTSWSFSEFMESVSNEREKKVARDLDTQINSITNSTRRDELLQLYNICFPTKNSKIYCRPCSGKSSVISASYDNTIKILNKKLHWALEIQKLEAEIDSLVNWTRQPKISQADYPSKKARLEKKLPANPTTQQKLDFLHPCKLKQYQSVAKQINAEYAPLSQIEINQLFCHLVTTSKGLLSNETSLHQIKMFCKLQSDVVNILQKYITISSDRAIVATLKNLKNLISQLAIDEESSPQQLKDVITQWQIEPSLVQAGLNNAQVLTPYSLFSCFFAAPKGVLTQILELIDKNSSRDYQAERTTGIYQIQSPPGLYFPSSV